MSPAKLVVLAAILTVGYLSLGITVSSRPPQPADLLGSAWFGAWTSGAWILTQSGFFIPLATLNAVVLVLGLAFRSWLPRAVFAVAMVLMTWITSNAFKELFHRPRPAHWLKLHETSYSYSSGHAADAVIVYGLWALFLWRSDLPVTVRLPGVVLLIGWALGLSWSRLALGVHYPSDVLGGWLLGGVMVCIGFAAYPQALESHGSAV